MSEASKGSLSSSTGTTQSGNGVSGGEESGFHSQHMYQQFTLGDKIQTPSILYPQRPDMLSYGQHTVSQQQGLYINHAPYEQLQQQQQQQQQLQQHYQQQHQPQHQQQYQQYQMQFIQQTGNLQHSMQYIQDTQKSSLTQSQQYSESSDLETQNRESSSRLTMTTEKHDTCTVGGTAEDEAMTPGELEKVNKAVEAVQAAHEKQVNELEARIKALEEHKSQKEVKYLRLRSSVSKNELQKKSHQSENYPKMSPIDDSQEEEMDTCEGSKEVDVFASCPSPVGSMHSDVSIKEEPVDDNPILTIQRVGTQDSHEQIDTKLNIDKENGKSGLENNSSKTYILSVTDFDFCIFCQSTSENSMVQLTEDILGTIEGILLNVDCEASQRLKDYIFDIELFLNNHPQYHSNCLGRLRSKMQNIRKKRKLLGDTDFLLCIICQEHRVESLYNFTNKGFSSLQCDLIKLDDEVIEKFKSKLNIDRLKNLLELESAKDEFSSEKFKYHRFCRYKFIKRRKKSRKTLMSTSRTENIENYPKNEEKTIEISPDEDIFELLAKRNKKIEEEKQKKLRKVLPEPNVFDYKKCILCGVQNYRKGKFRPVENTAIQKTIDNAKKNKHSDIIKILEHGVHYNIKLISHLKCFKCYNYSSKDKKATKGERIYSEMAFSALIAEIEGPMFRNGKVFSLDHLKEIFLKSLMEFKIESNLKMRPFINKIQMYYTFNDKCKVNVIPYPDYFVYSNHLNELQVAPQINKLRRDKENECNRNSKFHEEVGEENGEIKTKLRFSCTECGYKCNKKSSIKNHIKKHELGSIEKIVLSKEFMCDICGKMLKSQKSLQVHLNTHSGEKYSCSKCDKILHSKAALKNHVMTHTGDKNEECPDCGKKFLVKKYLYRHIREVHKNITDGQFLCPVCGKSFRTNERLKAHSVKHTDDKPFICKECGKAFKYRSVRRTHILAHKGKKPQMCSICSFGCYTKANLKLHMAIHTGSNEQVMCTENENLN